MTSFQQPRPREPVDTPQEKGEEKTFLRFWRKISKPLAKI